MREIAMLLDGITLGECPRWHEGRLWFSDWGARELVAVDMDGRREVIDRFDVMPFSFDWLPGGDQVVIPGKTLCRRNKNGVRVAWVDLSPFGDKGWNEIVADGRGNIYVNNVNFDFPGGEFRPGHAALVRPDGSVTIVARDLSFPNGMAVTPDNATLIVGESFSTTLSAYDIGADGGLSNRRVWAKLDGGPDDFNGDKAFSFGGAILAPFANRIRGRPVEPRQIEAVVDGHQVRLPRNWGGKAPGAEQYAMHGLILDAHAPYEVPSPDRITGRLAAGDFGGRWPGKLALDLAWRLEAGALVLAPTPIH